VSCLAAISVVMCRDISNPSHLSPSPDTGAKFLVCRIFVMGVSVSIDLGCALWVWKYMRRIGRATEEEYQMDASLRNDAERGL
jgi:hypothetical protein